MTQDRMGPAESDRAARASHPEMEAAPLDGRELVAIFWRRRWLILPVMVLVLGAFAVWALLKVPEYRALARVQVLREEPTVPSLATDVIATGLPSDPISSEIEILRSRSLLYAVADSLALQLTLGTSPWRRDLLFPGLAVAGEVVPGEYTLAFEATGVAVHDETGRRLAGGAPGEIAELAGIRFTLPQRPPEYPAQIAFELLSRREAGEDLYEEFRANVVQRTNLVDLSYHSHDPVLATEILDAIMELGRRQSVARLRERASARRRFIERQLAEFETQVREAQADVQAYQERIGAVSLESEQSGQIANILAFERQVEELRLERQLYQPILEGLDLEGTDQAASFEALAATPALVKNPAIADLYSRIVALEVKRDSLLSGPAGAGLDNPAVRAVDDQMVTAAAKLTEALREYIAGIDRQITELRRTIARLQRDSEGRLPHAAELARREQRVESLRKVYEALQTQLEQTRIEEASESGKLAIIDPAAVPREPVNATGIADIILALMLAGMLGFGGALVVDYFDDRVRSPREVRRNLGLTVLGVVPRFDSPDGRWSSDEQARVHLEQLSSPAEAYRMIRTNLSFIHAVKPRRTLLVTSPGPGEGKTTTAINLAAVLSQQGERTLLVDADLRKSSVHRLLGVRGEVGLTSVLTGEARLEDAILPAGIDKLEVLPAGPKPPNPAELLGAERMTELLAAVARRYERVVLDSAPVLAVADPATLARGLDGVVMVAWAGKTGRQALVEAIELLSNVGSDVLGVVVNALKPGLGVRGGGYYYYRDGYYGDRKRGVRKRLRHLVSGVGRARSARDASDMVQR